MRALLAEMIAGYAKALIEAQKAHAKNELLIAQYERELENETRNQTRTN